MGGGSVGRPRGQVRQALAYWAAQQAGQAHAQAGLTVVELVALVPGMHPKSPADRRMVSDCVKAMVKTGELVNVGSAPRYCDCGRPPGRYAPPLKAGHDTAAAASALASVLGVWVASRPASA